MGLTSIESSSKHHTERLCGIHGRLGVRTAAIAERHYLPVGRSELVGA